MLLLLHLRLLLLLLQLLLLELLVFQLLDHLLLVTEPSRVLSMHWAYLLATTRFHLVEFAKGVILVALESNHEHGWFAIRGEKEALGMVAGVQVLDD